MNDIEKMLIQLGYQQVDMAYHSENVKSKSYVSGDKRSYIRCIHYKDKPDGFTKYSYEVYAENDVINELCSHSESDEKIFDYTFYRNRRRSWSLDKETNMIVSHGWSNVKELGNMIQCSYTESQFLKVLKVLYRVKLRNQKIDLIINYDS